MQIVNDLVSLSHATDHVECSRWVFRSVCDFWIAVEMESGASDHAVQLASLDSHYLCWLSGSDYHWELGALVQRKKY